MVLVLTSCADVRDSDDLVAADPQPTQLITNEYAEFGHHHNQILISVQKVLKLHASWHGTPSAAKADTIAMSAMNSYLRNHSFDTISWSEWNYIRS